MEWSDFSGKNVGLLGAGLENIALVEPMKKAGAHVTVANEQETPATEELRKQGVAVVVGENYLHNLGSYDYVFRIAGMPVTRLQAALKGLQKKPIVTSPTDLFLALRPCHIVGVTGTKGKGTTSTLIGSILAAAGYQVAVVGNIGKPIFSIYEELTPEMYAVVELSSFQLEDVQHSPEIAVLLPIGEDHLQPLSERNPNYHPSLEAYRTAKAQITAFQGPTDLLVYAADSAPVRAIAERSAARRIAVGAGEADLEVDESGRVCVDTHELMNVAKLGLRGSHTFLDAGLAIAVARELGCDIDDIKKGLAAFQPLPHRLQTVTEVNGVTYVDDSYATAPDAAVAAVKAFRQPLIWIGGGSRKGASFEELAQTIARVRPKLVILMGDEAERLQAALHQAGSASPVTIAFSMSEAVTTARTHATAGDVVLLSPGCASFGMFKNAADRGDQFQQMVLSS